jgi:hypothetical protein
MAWGEWNAVERRGSFPVVLQRDQHGAIVPVEITLSVSASSNRVFSGEQLAEHLGEIV